MIIAILQAYKSKGNEPSSKNALLGKIQSYIANLCNPKVRKGYNKKKKEKNAAVTAKSKMPGFDASTEESAILAVIADTKERTAVISDHRKRANQASTGNGPPLSSTDQDLHDRQRLMDKKGDAYRSDCRKRANQASTGNGPPLSSTDQDLHDTLRARD